MSEENSLSQDAGDKSEQYAALGDMKINKPQLVINNQSGDKKHQEYLQLVKEFEEELEKGETTFLEFIDKIQHYVSNIDTEYIGLQAKLANAGFGSSYPRVSPLKEKYAMMLTENELSKSSQKIHAYLLAKVCSLFILNVNPAIDANYNQMQIFEIINFKVIQPVEEILAEKNVLDIYPDDILGMVYFLTGNCHLNWN